MVNISKISNYYKVQMKPRFKQIFIQLFKYLPPLGTLLLTVHTGLLLLGYKVPITQFLIDSSFLGGSLMIASSILFDMCKLHKYCIGYIITVTLLIDLHKVIGFGILLTPLKWIAFISGVILVILLIIKALKGCTIKSNC